MSLVHGNSITDQAKAGNVEAEHRLQITYNRMKFFEARVFGLFLGNFSDEGVANGVQDAEVVQLSIEELIEQG